MWSLVHPSRLYWEKLDSEWVVYEEASNQTMVLDAVSIDILISLKAIEMDESSLEKQVLEDLELDESDENRALVKSTIYNLELVGLVKHSKDAALSNQ